MKIKNAKIDAVIKGRGHGYKINLHEIGALSEPLSSTKLNIRSISNKLFNKFQLHPHLFKASLNFDGERECATFHKLRSSVGMMPSSKPSFRQFFKSYSSRLILFLGFMVVGAMMLQSHSAFSQQNRGGIDQGATEQAQNGVMQVPAPQAAMANQRQDVLDIGQLMDINQVLGINMTRGMSGAGPSYVTMNDVIRSLITNNRKVKADLMSLYGSRVSIEKADAEYSPEVVVGGSLTLNNIRPGEDDVDNDLEGGEWNRYTNNRMNITLQQRLYDFGYRDESMKAAVADYERQKASFKALLEEKILELVSLYGELRRSIMQYQSISDYYAQGLELYKVVKDRTENDLAPQSELNYVQLQLAEARQQLTQLASRITQSRRGFEQEVGLWPQQLAPMPAIPVNQIARASDVNAPARQSTQVVEMRAEVERRKAELALIDAEDKPDLSLEITGYRDGNRGNSDVNDVGINGVVSANWSLYDGGRQEAARKEALYQLRQSIYAVDYLSERAKGDALRRLIEVKQADKEIEVLRSMISYSDSIIRHNARLFQAGLVSATFMVGSLRERSSYRVRLLDLEHSRNVSSFGYAFAMGILPQQLGLNIDQVIASFNPNMTAPNEAFFTQVSNSEVMGQFAGQGGVTQPIMNQQMSGFNQQGMNRGINTGMNMQPNYNNLQNQAFNNQNSGFNMNQQGMNQTMPNNPNMNQNRTAPFPPIY